jgi:DNA-binding Xre family transcriptional regulator
MVQRFPRSLRARTECIEQVRRAVLRNGFARNQDLAEAAELALATVQNFLSAKPVSRENFFKLCSVLELDVEQIADFRTNSDVTLPLSTELPENLEKVLSSELLVCQL